MWNKRYSEPGYIYGTAPNTFLAGLEFVHAVCTEREVREGRGHTGLASVVQLLAVKRLLAPSSRTETTLVDGAVRNHLFPGG